MKNQQHFIAFILSLIIVVSGCKKEDITPDSNLPKLLLSEESETGEVTLYFYDDEERLSRVESPDGGSNLIYEGDMITVESYITSIPDNIISKIFLNDRGLADSTVFGNEITVYEYSGDGYLLKETHTINSFVSSEQRYFYDSNNNLEMELGYFSASVSSGTITEKRLYTYYEDENNELSNYNRGIYHQGKPSDNLLKSIVYERSESDILSFNDYSYDRDTDGCILSVTTESYNSGSPNERFFDTKYLTY